MVNLFKFKLVNFTREGSRVGQVRPCLFRVENIYGAAFRISERFMPANGFAEPVAGTISFFVVFSWLTTTKKISLYSSKKKSSHNSVRDVLGAGLALLDNLYKKDIFDKNH